MNSSTANYPLPVAAYLKHALHEGQHAIDRAHIIHKGEIRLGPDKRWLPFQAKEYLVPGSREFVWEASIQVAPLIKLNVKDAYLSAEGSSSVSFYSIPISKEQNSPELNSASLQRYLGESIWAPTALLVGNGPRWTSIDNRTALARLKSNLTEASLYFHFNENDEVTSISTPRRYRKVGKKFELTPWVVRLQNYKEVRGLLIPSYVEVEWLMPEGKFCWFRAEIIHVRYEFNKTQTVDFAELNAMEAPTVNLNTERDVLISTNYVH